MKAFKIFLSSLVLLSFVACNVSSKKQLSYTKKIANKPLYRDTIYDGAADPVVLWNKKEKSWFMFYTNRRANLVDDNVKDVSWVHGTPIGIAESKDNGASWEYKCDAKINFGDDSTTFWAPEVISYKGTFHMYLTIVPGIFTDWKHPRFIAHFTSSDALDWKFESKLELASEKVIDACVIQLPDGIWRLWYNNEKDGKSIYYADSPDLYNWKDKGKIIRNEGKSGEGPNVFQRDSIYYMIVDEWRGLGIYSSTDALNWKRQTSRILDLPGEGAEDQVIGNHADIVQSNDRAFIFYFTHPGRKNSENSAYEKARSLIQVAELEFNYDTIACNRNKPCEIFLQAP